MATRTEQKKSAFSAAQTTPCWDWTARLTFKSMYM